MIVDPFDAVSLLQKYLSGQPEFIQIILGNWDLAVQFVRENQSVHDYFKNNKFWDSFVSNMVVFNHIPKEENTSIYYACIYRVFLLSHALSNMRSHLNEHTFRLLRVYLDCHTPLANLYQELFAKTGNSVFDDFMEKYKDYKYLNPCRLLSLVKPSAWFVGDIRVDTYIKELPFHANVFPELIDLFYSYNSDLNEVINADIMKKICRAHFVESWSFVKNTKIDKLISFIKIFNNNSVFNYSSYASEEVLMHMSHNHSIFLACCARICISYLLLNFIKRFSVRYYFSMTHTTNTMENIRDAKFSTSKSKINRSVFYGTGNMKHLKQGNRDKLYSLGDPILFSQLNIPESHEYRARSIIPKKYRAQFYELKCFVATHLPFFSLCSDLNEYPDNLHVWLSDKYLNSTGDLAFLKDEKKQQLKSIPALPFFQKTGVIFNSVYPFQHTQYTSDGLFFDYNKLLIEMLDISKTNEKNSSDWMHVIKILSNVLYSNHSFNELSFKTIVKEKHEVRDSVCFLLYLFICGYYPHSNTITPFDKSVAAFREFIATDIPTETFVKFCDIHKHLLKYVVRESQIHLLKRAPLILNGLIANIDFYSALTCYNVLFFDTLRSVFLANTKKENKEALENYSLRCRIRIVINPDGDNIYNKITDYGFKMIVKENKSIRLQKKHLHKRVDNVEVETTAAHPLQYCVALCHIQNGIETSFNCNIHQVNSIYYMLLQAYIRADENSKFVLETDLMSIPRNVPDHEVWERAFSKMQVPVPIYLYLQKINAIVSNLKEEDGFEKFKENFSICISIIKNVISRVVHFERMQQKHNELCELLSALYQLFSSKSAEKKHCSDLVLFFKDMIKNLNTEYYLDTEQELLSLLCRMINFFTNCDTLEESQINAASKIYVFARSLCQFYINTLIESKPVKNIAHENNKENMDYNCLLESHVRTLEQQETIYHYFVKPKIDQVSICARFVVPFKIICEICDYVNTLNFQGDFDYKKLVEWGANPDIVLFFKKLKNEYHSETINGIKAELFSMDVYTVFVVYIFLNFWCQKMSVTTTFTDNKEFITGQKTITSMWFGKSRFERLNPELFNVVVAPKSGTIKSQFGNSIFTGSVYTAKTPDGKYIDCLRHLPKRANMYLEPPSGSVQLIDPIGKVVNLSGVHTNQATEKRPMNDKNTCNRRKSKKKKPLFKVQIGLYQQLFAQKNKKLQHFNFKYNTRVPHNTNTTRIMKTLLNLVESKQVVPKINSAVKTDCCGRVVPYSSTLFGPWRDSIMWCGFCFKAGNIKALNPTCHLCHSLLNVFNDNYNLLDVFDKANDTFLKKFVCEVCLRKLMNDHSAEKIAISPFSFVVTNSGTV